MPTYTYACKACGPFELRRPMAESGLPAPCPVCAADAPRTVSAPYVAGTGPSGQAPGSGHGGSGCGSGHCGHAH